MSGPSLPPKPLDQQHRSFLQSQPPSQPTQTEEQIIDYDKLQYPLIPPEITEKYLNFEIQVPQFLKDLNNSKLQELIKDQNLLKGYLLKNENFDKLDAEIIDILQKQLDYCERLLSKHNQEINPKVEFLSKQLEEYNQRLDAFNSLQVTMYDKLSKFSKESIVKNLESALTEQESVTKGLVADILSSPVELDESRMNQFVQDYKTERQKYHLTKEKLYRLHEDRVGGLDQ